MCIRDRSFLENYLVDGADVVLSTCTGSSTLDRSFRLVVMEEASRIAVPRALIAETIDLIAVLSGRGSERRLAELARVVGLGPSGDYAINPVSVDTSGAPS